MLYLETKFASLVSYGLMVGLAEPVAKALPLATDFSLFPAGERRGRMLRLGPFS